LNKILLTLLSAASLTMLGACATTDEAGSDMSADANLVDEDDGGERVYITGSIIPRKVRPGDVKTVDPAEIRGALTRQSNTGAGGG